MLQAVKIILRREILHSNGADSQIVLT